jgi:hypothetical protein
MHEFTIKDQGKLYTFNKFEDIPMEFDHLIKFVPHVPEPPHTEMQHEEIDHWNDKLKELMRRERNASNNT